MTRTSRQLLLSLSWLLGFGILVILVSSSMDLSDPGRNAFYGQLGSIVWVLGFVAIFFSWARVDAIQHGKSKASVVVFTLLWPLLIGFVHLGYLFYTRGLRNGLLASLKFVCFCLSAGLAMLVLAKLWGFFVA